MSTPIKRSRIANSFIYCGISHALDGSEDHLIHYFHWYQKQVNYVHPNFPRTANIKDHLLENSQDQSNPFD
jgi:hypothetical protein